VEVSFEGGEIELEEGRGDSEEKNGGGRGRVKWNGEDTGRFNEGRTRNEKKGKGAK